MRYIVTIVIFTAVSSCRKYKDDHALNQISLRGTEYDSPMWELEESEVGRGDGGSSDGGRVLVNPMVNEESDEENNLGEVRR